jgi:FkbM family methyltransferase
MRAPSAVLRHAAFSVKFARRLSSPWLYLLHEASPSRSIRTYRMRDSGVAVLVRHHTGDIGTLDEIFSQEVDRPPPAAMQALRSIGRPLVVGDLGANVGLFASYVLSRFDVDRLVAFEPDPVNFELLRRCALANQDLARWELTSAAARNRDGEVPFLGGQDAMSRVCDASETDARVRAVDVFGELDGIDLLKIDIEGSEWPILEDPRMAELGVRVLVLEYHPAWCPGPDAETEARNLLGRAGFRVLDHVRLGIPGHGTLWALPAR